jgi:hypothetical protein
MDIQTFKDNIIKNGKCTKNGVNGDVNIKISGLGIGGSFAILINWLTLFGDDVDNVYVDLTDTWKTNTGVSKNMFDLILDQKKIEGATEIQIYGHCLHNFNDNILNNIRSIINKKIKIKPEILKMIDDTLIKNNLSDINKFCGVHIRLTDMADYHKDIYGDVRFETYYQEMLKLDKNIKFFIASDNSESITKLKTLFPNRIYYINNIERVQKLNETGKKFKNKMGTMLFSLGIDRLNSDDKIINDFIDLMVLSKCNKLIGMKYSTYRIAALLLSNNITQNNNIELPLNYSL